MAGKDDTSKSSARSSGDAAGGASSSKVIKEDGSIPSFKSLGKSDDDGNAVVVKEDVVQEFYAEGSKRPSHRLLFAAGSTVTKGDYEFVKTNYFPDDSSDSDS